jgi:hypothetical protein
MEFRCERLYKSLIFISLRPAEAMVEVKYEKTDSEFGAQLEEQKQQPNRIRSAGDAYTDAISRAYHRMPINRVEDAEAELAGH